MKKTLVIVLCIILALTALTGCGQKGTTLKAVQKAGQIVIATSPDYPPFEDLGADGVEGIDIDIWNNICEKLGVSLKIEQVDFDSVLPGVQAGKFNVGVSGITITEARQKNVLFTDPYCLAAQSIVVLEGSPITCKADLEGKAVSVQTGTTAGSFCMAQGYTVNSYANNTDAQTAMVAGKADAWVIDDLTAASMVKIYNAEHDQKLVVLPDTMTTEPYAFAFAFGSEDLVKEINGIIAQMVADGTIEAIFEKYEAPYTSPAQG